MPKDLLDSWPALKAYRTKVASHPKVRRIGRARGLRGRPVAGAERGRGGAAAGPRGAAHALRRNGERTRPQVKSFYEKPDNQDEAR